MSVTIFSQPDSSVTSPLAERRSLTRLLASDDLARIAWKKQGLRLCKAPARLIDINANGASLVVARPAEPGQVLWLGMALLPWEWVKATIRATFSNEGRWRYHVAFCEPCPAGLLDQATGLAAPDQQIPSSRILRDDDYEECIWLTMKLL